MVTATESAHAHSDRVLEVFGRVARRPMVQAWGRNCCIAASRAAILVLTRFGVAAKAFSCKLCVEDRARNVAKLVGFTRQERQDINARYNPARVLDRSVPGEGWEGHVAVVVEKRLLLDASFDQAAEPELGLVIPEHVLMIPVPESFAAGTQEVKIEGTIDNGPLLRVRYWPSPNRSFKSEEAWRGLDARIMAAHVSLLIEEELRYAG
jgi:hypothetical protein